MNSFNLSIISDLKLNIQFDELLERGPRVCYVDLQDDSLLKRMKIWRKELRCELEERRYFKELLEPFKHIAVSSINKLNRLKARCLQSGMSEKVSQAFEKTEKILKEIMFAPLVVKQELGSSLEENMKLQKASSERLSLLMAIRNLTDHLATMVAKFSYDKPASVLGDLVAKCGLTLASKEAALLAQNVENPIVLDWLAQAIAEGQNGPELWLLFLLSIPEKFLCKLLISLSRERLEHYRSWAKASTAAKPKGIRESVAELRESCLRTCNRYKQILDDYTKQFRTDTKGLSLDNALWINLANLHSKLMFQLDFIDKLRDLLPIALLDAVTVSSFAEMKDEYHIFIHRMSDADNDLVSEEEGDNKKENLISYMSAKPHFEENDRKIKDFTAEIDNLSASGHTMDPGELCRKQQTLLIAIKNMWTFAVSPVPLIQMAIKDVSKGEQPAHVNGCLFGVLYRVQFFNNGCELDSSTIDILAAWGICSAEEYFEAGLLGSRAPDGTFNPFALALETLQKYQLSTIRDLVKKRIFTKDALICCIRNHSSSPSLT